MSFSRPMLCYVDDRLPGITRRRAGRGWAYHDAEGNRITDHDEIDRLNRIGLPPAAGLPRATRFLSPAERGLLAFLETLAKERSSTDEAA